MHSECPITVVSEAPPYLVGRFEVPLKSEGARLSCKPARAEIVANQNGTPCDLRVCYEWGAQRDSYPTVATFEGVIAKFLAHVSSPGVDLEELSFEFGVSGNFKLETSDATVHWCEGFIQWQETTSKEHLYLLRLDIGAMPEFWTHVWLKVDISEAQ